MDVWTCVSRLLPLTDMISAVACSTDLHQAITPALQGAYEDQLYSEIDQLHSTFEARLENPTFTFEVEQVYVLPTYFLFVEVPSWDTLTVSDFTDASNSTEIPLHELSRYPMSRPVSRLFWTPRIPGLPHEGVHAANLSRIILRSHWPAALRQAARLSNQDEDNEYWIHHGY